MMIRGVSVHPQGVAGSSVNSPSSPTPHAPGGPPPSAPQGTPQSPVYRVGNRRPQWSKPPSKLDYLPLELQLMVLKHLPNDRHAAGLAGTSRAFELLRETTRTKTKSGWLRARAMHLPSAADRPGEFRAIVAAVLKEDLEVSQEDPAAPPRKRRLSNAELSGVLSELAKHIHVFDDQRERAEEFYRLIGLAAEIQTPAALKEAAGSIAQNIHALNDPTDANAERSVAAFTKLTELAASTASREVAFQRVARVIIDRLMHCFGHVVPPAKRHAALNSLLNVAKAIEDPAVHADATGVLAAGVKFLGSEEEKRTVFDLLLKTVEAIKTSTARASATVDLANTIEYLPEDEARSAFDSLTVIAGKIDDQAARAYAAAALADAIGHLGSEEEKKNAFRDLFDIANAMNDPTARGETAAALAYAIEDLPLEETKKAFDDLLEIAKAIDDPAACAGVAGALAYTLDSLLPREDTAARFGAIADIADSITSPAAKYEVAGTLGRRVGNLSVAVGDDAQFIRLLGIAETAEDSTARCKLAVILASELRMIAPITNRDAYARLVGIAERAKDRSEKDALVSVLRYKPKPVPDRASMTADAIARFPAEKRQAAFSKLANSTQLSRAATVDALAPAIHLLSPGKERKDAFSSLLEIARTISDAEERAQALSAVADNLGAHDENADRLALFGAVAGIAEWITIPAARAMVAGALGRQITTLRADAGYDAAFGRLIGIAETTEDSAARCKLAVILASGLDNRTPGVGDAYEGLVCIAEAMDRSEKDVLAALLMRSLAIIPVLGDASIDFYQQRLA